MMSSHAGRWIAFSPRWNKFPVVSQFQYQNDSQRLLRVEGRYRPLSDTWVFLDVMTQGGMGHDISR